MGAYAVQAEIKKKRNRSKSSDSNIINYNEHLLDITPESIQNLLDDILTNQNLEDQIEDRNILNTSSVTKNILSATLPNNSNMSVISETISSTDMKQDNTEVRVLRNRTITTTDTPKTNRRSKMVSYDINDLA